MGQKMTTRETFAVNEEMYELIRDGVEYSVSCKAECEMLVTYEPEEPDCPAYAEAVCESVEITEVHVDLYELGTEENGWDYEVKDFQFTEEEMKALKDFLAEKAIKEINVLDYID